MTQRFISPQISFLFQAFVVIAKGLNVQQKGEREKKMCLKL